jgi:hypothetical protein
VSKPPEIHTIGHIARRIGVPARTIRFWCDAGILSPAGRSARGYRQFDAAADPTPEQVDAWIELAGLMADEDFERRVREMVLAGTGAKAPPSPDYGAVIERAGRALAAGIDPASAEAKPVLDAIVPPGTPLAERDRIRRELETFADERVERYWQLVGTLNGRPPFTRTVPAFRWLIASLRAHA